MMPLPDALFSELVEVLSRRAMSPGGLKAVLPQTIFVHLPSGATAWDLAVLATREMAAKQVGGDETGPMAHLARMLGLAGEPVALSLRRALDVDVSVGSCPYSRHRVGQFRSVLLDHETVRDALRETYEGLCPVMWVPGPIGHASRACADLALTVGYVLGKTAVLLDWQPGAGLGTAEAVARAIALRLPGRPPLPSMTTSREAWVAVLADFIADACRSRGTDTLLAFRDFQAPATPPDVMALLAALADRVVDVVQSGPQLRLLFLGVRFDEPRSPTLGKILYTTVVSPPGDTLYAQALAVLVEDGMERAEAEAELKRRWPEPPLLDEVHALVCELVAA